MSGLLALFDDVAAIAKLAAAQADDVAGQAAKVGSKAAGVVIDDAAVTPKYVSGLPAARELPIVWRIARASAFNKLVLLLPAALLIDAFAPWLLAPILILGGTYLCFEGAEKVWHALFPHDHDAHGHGHGDSKAQQAETLDAAQIEETRVRGAIKTDLILSAEIMAIALAAIEAEGVLARGLVLAVVAVAITAAVYGAVAALVKADDLGLRMSARGRLPATRALGRGIVVAMPGVLVAISVIGTAAMLWVGGNIVVHSLHEMGLHGPYEAIHGLAEAAGGGFAGWAVTAAIDGVLGLLLGLALIPVVGRAVRPLLGALRGA